jgi:glycosyltransferase involved in cell wall biosynthesis
MIRVLVDSRVTGHDGIGRYTTCLTAALGGMSGPDLDVAILNATGTPRYSREEGTELAQAARKAGADLIHVLDYRIPAEPLSVPIVAMVHDVLRLDQRHCYADDQFAARFGHPGLSRLREAVQALRRLPRPGAPAAIAYDSLHAEFYARMLYWTCQRACRVVTPTRTVAQQLISYTGLGAAPIAIPLGIDHSSLDPGTGRLGSAGMTAPPSRYLLYVGQARPHKGLADLLAAYRHSRASHDGVPLVCVGRDFIPGTDAHQQLSAIAGRAGIALGPVADSRLRSLYARAEALVHLAAHEGFGFTPLEAMAAGTRVIASDIPVLRETLGTHAYFADPRSPHDVAMAINQVLTEPDDLLAQAERIRWAKGYTWQQHITRVTRVYRDCLPGGSP